MPARSQKEIEERVRELTAEILQESPFEDSRSFNALADQLEDVCVLEKARLEL